MVSVAGPTRASHIRVRRGAPDGRGGRPSGLEPWSAGGSCSGVLRAWTQTGALRFPGHPSHAFALFQDPGRADRSSP